MLWKDKYNIGVELIDRQHKELFDRVERFVTTLRAPGPWEDKVEQVNETLAFMKEYVIVHFTEEEEYQKSIGYPDMDEHCRMHSQLIQEVADFAEKFASQGYREELAQQFGGRLLAWLIHHVAATDQKIAAYAHRMKGGAQ